MIRRYDRRQDEHYVNQIELDHLEDVEIRNGDLETGLLYGAYRDVSIIENDPIDARDLNVEDAVGSEEDSLATATDAKTILRQSLQGGADDRNDE